MVSEPDGVFDSDTVLDDKAEELKSNSVHSNMNTFLLMHSPCQVYVQKIDSLSILISHRIAVAFFLLYLRNKLSGCC